jgi:SNF2 family DNA or RNA helicase
MVVIDEAHRIKGGGASIRWRACRALANYSKRVDLLTGTPMPQSQEDLKNLLSLSWRGVPREFFSDTRLSNLKRVTFDVGFYNGGTLNLTEENAGRTQFFT